MTRLTKPQMRAILRKAQQADLSYRQLRRGAQPTSGCDDAIALPWCGMWLCIETDGYTHS